MAMNPPTVLLDDTFLRALLQHEHPQHAEARATYADLVAQFRTQQVLLLATGPSLRGIDQAIRRGLLAPLDSVHMAGRYRSAARRVVGYGQSDRDFAALLVLLRRERISRVASFDPRFADLDVTVMPAPHSPQVLAAPRTDDQAAAIAAQPAPTA